LKTKKFTEMNAKLLFIFLSLTFFTTTFAQWQLDLRLTNDPAQSYMSGPHQHDIASNGNTIHVVWHDERTNWDIYYKRSPDGGLSWGADTRLSNGPGESHSASVAVSGSNVIVVWNDSRDGHWELFYIRSTDGGISWGTETRLTANDSFSSSNPVAASIGSVFHLVWEDGRDGNEEIYYKRSTDGGLSWSTDVRLTNNTAVSYSPSVTVSGSFVLVVWYDDRDGNNEIYYKRSTDGHQLGN
jgi:predicted neuraminidase